MYSSDKLRISKGCEEEAARKHNEEKASYLAQQASPYSSSSMLPRCLRITRVSRVSSEVSQVLAKEKGS